MTTFNPLQQWENGISPRICLEAYKVVIDPHYGYRTFVRNSMDIVKKDIWMDYIDMDSIHFEMRCLPNEIFEPGGIIASHLTLRMLPGSGVDITPVPNPKHASDYEYVYFIKLLYPVPGAQSPLTYIGSPMIVTSKSNTRRDGKDHSITLTLDDELIVFENMEYAPHLINQNSTTLVEIFDDIMQQAGFPTVYYEREGEETVSDLISDIQLLYSQHTLTARQVLSFILQASGCFITNSLHGSYTPTHCFTITALANPDDTGAYCTTLPNDYMMDYHFDDDAGQWDSVIVRGVDDRTDPGAHRGCYYITDNIFIYTRNASGISTRLNHYMQDVYTCGFECQYMLCPHLELGDWVGVEYVPNFIQGFMLTEFEWNGGAFCTLKSAKWDKDYWRNR